MKLYRAIRRSLLTIGMLVCILAGSISTTMAAKYENGDAWDIPPQPGSTTTGTWWKTTGGYDAGAPYKEIRFRLLESSDAFKVKAVSCTGATFPWSTGYQHVAHRDDLVTLARGVPVGTCFKLNVDSENAWRMTHIWYKFRMSY